MCCTVGIIHDNPAVYPTLLNLDYVSTTKCRRYSLHLCCLKYDELQVCFLHLFAGV
jgi:hypothetical protein